MKNLTVFSIEKKINKIKIHKLVSLLSKELSFSISGLEINFIDQKNILEINKKYLKHNYFTDILTFSYSKSLKDIDGEMYISVSDAKINAKRYKVNFLEEISRLVIHGILHLIGYNDQTKKDKNVMKKIENRLLMKYKFVLLG